MFIGGVPINCATKVNTGTSWRSPGAPACCSRVSPVDDGRAAMHVLQEAARLQFVEVAADGGDGDVQDILELLGIGKDFDAQMIKQARLARCQRADMKKPGAEAAPGFLEFSG